jgi:predicted transcriptional regulator
MSQTSVLLSDETHRVLQVLSKQTGKSIPDILDEAVEEYRLKVAAEEEAREFAALKADAEAWGRRYLHRRLLMEILRGGNEPDEAAGSGARPEGERAK